MLRRRGASRGRPVLRWFAYVPRVHAGVSEGAKRLSGVLGTREPTLGCLTQRIRNLPFRATWRFNMKMVKSLLLGSPAGFLPPGGAHAAPLPLKPTARPTLTDN